MSAPTPRLSSARPAWDSAPPPRRRPTALVLAALVLLVPAVGATLLRVFPPSDDTGAMLASFVPYGLLAYVLALVLLLVALVRAARRTPLVGRGRNRWTSDNAQARTSLRSPRSRYARYPSLVGLAMHAPGRRRSSNHFGLTPLAILTVVVAALTGLHVSWLAPLFVPDHRPVVGPSFTVLAQNVHLGLADTNRLTQVASNADVVVLSETTRTFLADLQTPTWDAHFPYGVGDLSGAPSDTTVFSRFPLADAQLLAGSTSTQWVMTVDVPGRTPVRLVGTHPCNPYCGGGAFARDHAVLEETVRANLSLPLVVAGDLNAIDDHAPLLRLRADGLRSATDLVGAGWVPTYPADRAFPPLLPIDHVLVDDQLTATTLRTVRMPGSDHLGLLTTIAGTR